jgi:lipoyl(octanoyl) transferase
MPPDHEPAALEAYLLGRVGFDALLAWQRRMVYEVSGDRRRGILALCELDPIITVGRTGSHQDVQIPSRELATRGWPVKWVNRGGGTVLHTPGQLQVVAILALDALGVGLSAYLEQLHDAILSVAQESEIRAEVIPGKPGVWARGRLIAPVGVAVHDWVAYFGASLNIDCDLEHYRDVRCEGHALPMTSLERERHGPVRPGFVRQLVVEAIAERFGFPRTSIFHHHPALTPSAVRADYFSRSA